MFEIMLKKMGLGAQAEAHVEPVELKTQWVTRLTCRALGLDTARVSWQCSINAGDTGWASRHLLYFGIRSN